jgi:hypothetical protein
MIGSQEGECKDSEAVYISDFRILNREAGPPASRRKLRIASLAREAEGSAKSPPKGRRTFAISYVVAEATTHKNKEAGRLQIFMLCYSSLMHSRQKAAIHREEGGGRVQLFMSRLPFAKALGTRSHDAENISSITSGPEISTRTAEKIRQPASFNRACSKLRCRKEVLATPHARRVKSKEPARRRRYENRGSGNSKCVASRRTSMAHGGRGWG